ncbi:MAG: hypothetical protein ABIR17_00175 [Pseudolysinimonas sp.]|uniref:SecDF P1 head subdomain-containing protein n=1 Tax=Pseudolysinimonas sp. TaxID=2680009 RepID=UPI003263B1E1
MKSTRWWIPFLVIAGVVVIGLVVAGVVLTSLFVSRSNDLVAPDGAPTLVVAVGAANGSSIDSGALDVAIGIATDRLDAAEIDYADIGRSSDHILVVFSKGTSDETRSRARAVLTPAYSLEFRPVLAADQCDQGLTTSAIGDNVTLCDQAGTAMYALGPIAIDGKHVDSVTAATLAGAGGVDTGTWVVNLVFDDQGTQAFADFTQRAVGQTPPLNQFAMVLDGRVLSAPAVQAAVTDGKPQITGGFDEAGARDLAGRLDLASRGLTFQVR